MLCYYSELYDCVKLYCQLAILLSLKYTWPSQKGEISKGFWRNYYWQLHEPKPLEQKYKSAWFEAKTKHVRNWKSTYASTGCFFCTFNDRNIIFYWNILDIDASSWRIIRINLGTNLRRFFFSLFLRLCWRSTIFRMAGSQINFLGGRADLDFYLQSEAGIKTRTAGWEARTLPLCYAIPQIFWDIFQDSALFKFGQLMK